MSSRTLVLDAGYQPHRVVGWQRAVQLLLDGRAEIVELYEETLRSMSREAAKALKLSEQATSWFEMGTEHTDADVCVLRMPAVIRLLGKVGRKKAVKFSRINVLTRDNWTCQYCGQEKPMRELNYDHVLPRSRGGKTVWENIVSACYECNAKKRNRTPEEAGMRLRVQPRKPLSLPLPVLRLEGLRDIPECWRSWLYWTVELEP